MTTTAKPTGPIIGSVDRPVSFTMVEGSPASGRVEPITLAGTRAALKIPGSSTAEDELIAIWIGSAREFFERITGRQIINATWEYALDDVPAWPRIELPRPPLFNVESVIYDDGDGNEVTLDASTYTVLKSGIFDGSPLSGALDPHCGCGAIELTDGSSWPTTSGLGRSFRVRRTCGYGETPDEVPMSIRGHLYKLVDHYYRNRSVVTERGLSDVPGAESALLEFKYSALQTLLPRTA